MVMPPTSSSQLCQITPSIQEQTKIVIIQAKNRGAASSQNRQNRGEFAAKYNVRVCRAKLDVINSLIR